MKNTAWKFLLLRDGQVVSARDQSPWTIGKWREVPVPTEEYCGLNCFERIEQAYYHVKGDILARVEYKGTVIRGVDKLTCQRMRIKQAWHFPATAWAAYQQAEATARVAYEQATATARETFEFEKATATAGETFEKAKATAWEIFEKATATAWETILRTLKPVGAEGGE